MAIMTSQDDFDPSYFEEFRKKLLIEIPSLENLIEIIRKFCALNANGSKSSPCHACLDRSKCQKPCDRLNALLPKVYKGKGQRENLTGLYPDALQKKEIIRRKDIFKQYKLWKEDYTQAQWEVIELYYNQCMSEMQISKKLGKRRSTINGRLIRARKRKEERQKQLRRETREQLKNEKEDKF